MGLNPLGTWFRSHPILISAVGVVIAALGVIRGQPIAIALGVVVVLVGVLRVVV